LALARRNAFFAGQDAVVSIADATSQFEESSHLDSQVAFVISRLEDQEDSESVFIPVDGGASSHVWKNPSMFISMANLTKPPSTLQRKVKFCGQRALEMFS
jgi:hypothetical protein